MFFQDKHTSCQQYYESFKNNADVLGALGQEPGLTDADLDAIGVKLDDAMDVELAAAEATVKECMLVIGLLIGSDCAHYGKLLEDLENDVTQGQDNYPANLQQNYSLLVHGKQDPHKIVRAIGWTNDGMAFANVGIKDSG